MQNNKIKPFNKPFKKPNSLQVQEKLKVCVDFEINKKIGIKYYDQSLLEFKTSNANTPLLRIYITVELSEVKQRNLSSSQISVFSQIAIDTNISNTILSKLIPVTIYSLINARSVYSIFRFSEAFIGEGC